jgi:tetratricopeptide (TPR) repeat protein
LAIPICEKNGNNLLAAYSLRARAVAYAGLGDLVRTQADFNDSMRRAPGNAWLYYSIGQVMDNLGNSEQALKYYMYGIGKTDPPLTSRRLNAAVDRALLLINKEEARREHPLPQQQSLSQSEWVEVAGNRAIVNGDYALAIGAFTLAILKWPSERSYSLRGDHSVGLAYLNPPCRI